MVNLRQIAVGSLLGLLVGCGWGDKEESNKPVIKSYTFEQKDAIVSDKTGFIYCIPNTAHCYDKAAVLKHISDSLD